MTLFSIFNDEAVLLLIFFLIFGFVYIPLSYMMRHRKDNNPLLTLLVSISISLLSVLFITNNAWSMIIISKVFLFLPFLGLGFVILSGLSLVASTNRDKWLILFVLGFLLFLYWLIVFKTEDYSFVTIGSCNCICD